MINEEEIKTKPRFEVPVWSGGKDEMNLVEFPFALLTDRAEGIVTIEFSDTIIGQDGKRVPRKWTVTSSEKFGMPTRDDEKVYVALMQISKENGLESARQFFTRYRAINIIGWPHTGTYYNRIESALDRLTGVTIKAENAFYDPVSESYSTESFHIIDNYRLWDRDKPSGTGQQALPLSYFKWNEVVWKSIENGYIKNLDTSFWFSLQGPITRRLHRYLDKKFYQKHDFLIDYRKLGFEKLGINRNSRPAKVRGFIAAAAQELIERGYLKTFEFDGSQAVFRRATKAARERVDSKPTLTGGQSNLKKELVQRGITESIAHGLVQQFGADRIEEKIELYEHLRSIKSDALAKNPAGYLRRAIEDNYAPPEGFLSRKQKAEMKARAKERDRQQQLAKVEAEFRDWLKLTDEEKVSGHIWIWKMRFKRENGREATSTELQEQKAELLANIPTPEEYKKVLLNQLIEAPEGGMSDVRQ